MQIGRAFFTWLKDEGYVKRNPFESITRESKRTGSACIRMSLSEDQVDKLLSTLKDNTLINVRNAAIIKLMIFTGLRCIEISRLRNGDIRKVENSWYAWIMRKGHRDRDGRIMIPDMVLGSLESYMSQKDDADMADAPLFAGHGPASSRGHLSTKYIYEIIKRQFSLIGLERRGWSAHSLRHTAACLAFHAGAKIEEICIMLGHANISVTIIYLRSLGQHIDDNDTAIRKIQQFWGERLKRRLKVNHKINE
jgi:site-specific recombinase XerD